MFVQSMLSKNSFYYNDDILGKHYRYSLQLLPLVGTEDHFPDIQESGLLNLDSHPIQAQSTTELMINCVVFHIVLSASNQPTQNHSLQDKFVHLNEPTKIPEKEIQA